MIFETFICKGLAINSYLVGDAKTKKCAIIDPTRNADLYIEASECCSLEITDILETHLHADFVSGSVELKNRLGGKPKIHSSAMGGPDRLVDYADVATKDGDKVELGSLVLEAMHAPGHTPEHLVWLLYDTVRSKDIPMMIFTGDLLFVGSIGRPDLLGKDAQEKLAGDLYDTLFNKFSKLPDYVAIYPAHGAGSACGKNIDARPSSTIGYERKSNPFFSIQKNEWMNTFRNEKMAIPKYFKHMIRINKKGAPPTGTLPELKELRAEDVEKDSTSSFLLDTRSQEEFTKGHIKNSVSIPFGDNFLSWAGWILPYDQPITVIASSKEIVTQVLKQLRIIGIDNTTGYFILNAASEASISSKLVKLPEISAKDLEEALAKDDSFVVVDVRTPIEWDTGHISKAMHIELGYLQEQLNTIPRDKKIAATCASGFRATVAASLLQKEGFKEVYNLKGGMRAWSGEKKTCLSCH